MFHLCVLLIAAILLQEMVTAKTTVHKVRKLHANISHPVMSACILMFVGLICTHIHKNTRSTLTHTCVISHIIYNIVQANNRLLSALKYFFQFECLLNESLCILLLVSTQSHILCQSLPTHSAVNAEPETNSSLWCSATRSQYLIYLHLSLLFFCCLAWGSCNYADLATSKPLFVYI